MTVNEGLPRSSLEPLALGLKCVLSVTVPEFEKFCPDFVCRDRRPDKVVELIGRIIEQDVYPEYPIEQHDQSRVISEYLKYLETRCH